MLPKPKLVQYCPILLTALNKKTDPGSWPVASRLLPSSARAHTANLVAVFVQHAPEHDQQVADQRHGAQHPDAEAQHDVGHEVLAAGELVRRRQTRGHVARQAAQAEQVRLPAACPHVQWAQEGEQTLLSEFIPGKSGLQPYACWLVSIRCLASLTPAALGRGVNITPPPDFLDNSRTALAIDTKLAVPSFASIWHMLWKFWRNSSGMFGNNEFYNVTTRDFREKTGRYSNSHISFNYQAILGCKTSTYAECWDVQLCYLKISQFWIFDPEIFKQKIREKCYIFFLIKIFEKP